MPRRLHKPTELAKGHGPLIDMLWTFYLAAHEPSLMKIEQAITELGDDQQKATANRETIRRTLRAVSLPQWLTVEVIFLALCRIADVDPDDAVYYYDFPSEFDRLETPESHRERLYKCHQLAKHGAVIELPRTRPEKARQEEEARQEQEAARARWRQDDDPWGSPPKQGHDDEPPF